MISIISFLVVAPGNEHTLAGKIGERRREGS
jgi:hypothetical protein